MCIVCRRGPKILLYTFLPIHFIHYIHLIFSCCFRVHVLVRIIVVIIIINNLNWIQYKRTLYFESLSGPYLKRWRLFWNPFWIETFFVCTIPTFHNIVIITCRSFTLPFSSQRSASHKICSCSVRRWIHKEMFSWR